MPTACLHGSTRPPAARASSSAAVSLTALSYVVSPDVDVKRAGEFVVVRVRDQGVGIDPSDLATVFEPFSQVGRDQLVEKADGTGLGLALAKAVVEAHGGWIAADSSPGAGSTFTVRLPVTPLHVPAN